MALPRKLKYLNMFNDGLSYMGVVESVTLPKLTRKLENYRGGGMNGAAPIDLGLDDDALTVEWSVGGLPDVALWAQYAAPGADAVPLRFAGSYQRDDTSEVIAVEVVMRGRHKEIDGGENKQGENTSTKLSTVWNSTAAQSGCNSLTGQHCWPVINPHSEQRKTSWQKHHVKPLNLLIRLAMKLTP